MRKKLILIGLVLGGLFLVVGIIGGCGLTPKTGATNSYYYPDWTPQGKIICVKEVEEWTETTPWPFGAPMRSVASTAYYIITMSEEGTQETDIKQINSLGKVAASPLGNYIAYTDGNYIRIITTSGVDVNSIGNTTKVYSCDWNPDEEKLVYGTSTFVSDGVYIINRDGTNKQIIKDGSSVPIAVSWASDNSCVAFNSYVYEGSVPIDGGLYLYSIANGQISQITTIEGARPSFSPTSTDIVFDDGTDGLKRIVVESKIVSQVTIEVFYWPKYSPSGSKLVCGDMDNSGIWIINVDGTELWQVK